MSPLDPSTFLAKVLASSFGRSSPGSEGAYSRSSSRGSRSLAEAAGGAAALGSGLGGPLPLARSLLLSGSFPGGKLTVRTSFLPKLSSGFPLLIRSSGEGPAQFRRRTSMLGLPGEIYDKYDRIVKTCRVCSTSVPSPPRASIAGLRASSFRDLIFVGRLWELFDKGLKRTIVFRRESLEIKHVSPISSCHITSFMVLLLIHGGRARTPWPNRAETTVRLFHVHGRSWLRL